MTVSTRTWSPQQQAFLSWCADGKGSCVLEAVAGAGKSTVLREAARIIRGQTALVSYNKDIATENKAELTKMGVDWKKAQAGTVHSFGYAAFRKAHPNHKVEEHKVSDLAHKLIEDYQAKKLAERSATLHPCFHHRDEAVTLVGLAKQMAFGVPGHPSISDKHEWLEMADHFDVFENGDDEMPAPVDAVIEFAQQLLHTSNNDLDVIDFDDMVYLPVLHRMRVWQFDNVFLDEAQDTNAARRAMVRVMLKKGGRLAAVGDRNQAIYGFTGADADSLDLIKRDFNCIELPLTITFRCPKTVVEFARQWVSHITAAETAPEGSVSQIAMEQFLIRNDLTGGAAVLSRVNKPLVSLAFQLIRKRIPCRVEGRDIGQGIKKLLQRWKVKSLDQLEVKLEAYLARETTKLLAAKKESKLAEVEDRVETARVIIDQCRQEQKYTIADAVAYVDSLFGDRVDNMLVLSSIHKAKGREWQRVFWLDRAGTCPSKWARQAWQHQQEINLMYVAATRSKDQLIEVTVPVQPKEKVS
jgi:ATP-dependent DNA helicase UvrD/PcrA